VVGILGVDGMVILKQILKYSKGVRTGFIWLAMGSIKRADFLTS
jgi:hypothetical protein